MDDLLLFEKWSMSDVQVRDLGLQKYINLRPIIIPHSGGRHSSQRFNKNRVNIVERFTNKLMRPGKNAGKKMLVTSAMEAAFELVHRKTNTNPVQVLVDAVINAAPREETTRVSYGGVAQHQAVDVAPLRRVDLSLRFLTEGIGSSSFSSLKTFAEIISDELIAASRNESGSTGVRKRLELERIAYSAR
ncbi:MAG: 30S ribosomal protein S7 [Candidatus Kariarchaeaceae archaeon]|jgi:small subunit ribosomal protein S7